MAILADPTEPDSVAIVSQPAVGRAIAREDGRVGIDLLDHDPDGDIVVVYDRTKAGVTQRVTATVTVAPAIKLGGWGRANYYKLETDPTTDRIIKEPGETTRKVHITASGAELDAAAIEAMEVGYSNVSAASVGGAWLAANKAQGGANYYGETPELALNQTLGTALFETLADTLETSPWILFERGYEYPTDSNLFRSAIGESKLHPIVQTSYGTGAFPRYTGPVGPSVTTGAPTNIVVQDLRFNAMFLCNDPSWLIVDNFYTGCEEGDDGMSFTFSAFKRGITIRNGVVLDAWRKGPTKTQVPDWHLQDDRVSGIYLSGIYNGLVENLFIAHTGWEDGYRADGNAAFPQPPSDRSHNIYEQTDCFNMTKRNLLLTDAAGNSIQNRANGIAQRIVTLNCNTGLTMGPGVHEAGVSYGTHGLVTEYVQTHAGGRNVWPRMDGEVLSQKDLGARGWGVVFQDKNLALDRVVMINADPGSIPEMTSSTDIGPVGDLPDGVTDPYAENTYAPDGSATTILRAGYQFARWGEGINGTFGVDGIDSGVLNDTKISVYADERFSTTGSTAESFIAAVRAIDVEDKPWNEAIALINWTLARLGHTVPNRSLPADVHFLPHPEGFTPGFRWDIELDCSTGDLPGTVAGDSMYIDGHYTEWNGTPKNSIDEVHFGVGGYLAVLGGALRPTGQVVTSAGGNTLEVAQGAKFDLETLNATAGNLIADVTEARLLITGTVSGVDLVANYKARVIVDESGELTTDSATIYGKGMVGFDGTAGGTATINLTGTTTFKPTVVLPVAGLSGGPSGYSTGYDIAPKLGAVVTGLTSGATGVVVDLIFKGSRKANVALKNVSGVFVSGETLQADCEAGPVPTFDANSFGTVESAPVVTIGKIREALFAATAVNSVVNMNDDIEVETNGVAAGTYDLIDVDSLTDNGATLPSGVAVVGNKLVLTVS